MPSVPFVHILTLINIWVLKADLLSDISEKKAPPPPQLMYTPLGVQMNAAPWTYDEWWEVSH